MYSTELARYKHGMDQSQKSIVFVSEKHHNYFQTAIFQIIIMME